MLAARTRKRRQLSRCCGRGVLLVLAAPALGMKTEKLRLDKQFGDRRRSSATYKQITEAFPGGPEPARVVVKADDIDAPPVQRRSTTSEVQAAIGEFRHGPITWSRTTRRTSP